jgi:hypothetical protein
MLRICDRFVGWAKSKFKSIITAKIEFGEHYDVNLLDSIFFYHARSTSTSVGQ